MSPVDAFFFFLIALLLAYILYSWPRAWRHMWGGGALAFFAWVGFPFRVVMVIGCIGHLFGSSIAEDLYGFNPIGSLFGSPHFYKELRIEHKCIFEQNCEE